MGRVDFMMGADPEFGMLTKSGMLRSANTIIGDERMSAEFGTDGHSTIAELRPKPAVEPIDLVRNLRKCMQDGIRKYPVTATYEWKAGGTCYGESIGGHIHFGINAIAAHNRRNTDLYWGAMHRSLAYLSLLLEDPVESCDRRSGSYGLIDDSAVRTDHSHGPEYRPLSSWLTSPYIALGVLSIAKVVMNAMLFEDVAELPDLKAISIADFKSCSRPELKSCIPSIKRFLRKCSTYDKYERPIAFILNLCENNRSWFPRCGMKAAWGLSKSVESSLPEYLPKIKLRNLLEEIV